ASRRAPPTDRRAVRGARAGAGPVRRPSRADRAQGVRVLGVGGRGGVGCGLGRDRCAGVRRGRPPGGVGSGGGKGASECAARVHGSRRLGLSGGFGVCPARFLRLRRSARAACHDRLHLRLAQVAGRGVGRPGGRALLRGLGGGRGCRVRAGGGHRLGRVSTARSPASAPGSARGSTRRAMADGDAPVRGGPPRAGGSDRAGTSPRDVGGRADLSWRRHSRLHPRSRGGRRPAPGVPDGRPGRSARVMSQSESLYAFYPVFATMGFEGVDLDDAAQEVEILFKELADRAQVRGVYSTVGFRPDADLMLWLVAPSPDDAQDALVAFRRTRAGRALRLTWSFMGVVKPAEFTADHSPAFVRGEPPRKYLCAYPFVRTPEWYLLPKE